MVYCRLTANTSTLSRLLIHLTSGVINIIDIPKNDVNVEPNYYVLTFINDQLLILFVEKKLILLFGKVSFCNRFAIII